MVTITAKFALFPDPEGRMRLRRAIQLDEGPGDRLFDALDGRVIDIVLGADGAATTVLLDDGRIVEISNLDGTRTTVATTPGATNIVLDDNARTAVIDNDGRVTILDRHHNPVTSVDVPSATGLEFSQPRHAFVTFDSANQELALIDAIPGNPVRLERQPLIPDGPPIAPTATLSVNPSNGIVGLLEPDTNRLTRSIVSEDRFTTVDSIAFGDGAPLRGLVADATGAWYSTRNGTIVAFDIDGNELPDNPFAGQPSAPTFGMFQPMNIGTPPDDPNLLPQDAPRVGDQLALDQAPTTETVDDAHAVTVTLTDATGAPLADGPIAFGVAGVSSVMGTATTDETGRAVLSWTATTPGDDRLTAWEDGNHNSAHDPDEPAASIETTWTELVATATSVALRSSANSRQASASRSPRRSLLPDHRIARRGPCSSPATARTSAPPSRSAPTAPPASRPEHSPPASTGSKRRSNPPTAPASWHRRSSCSSSSGATHGPGT